MSRRKPRRGVCRDSATALVSLWRRFLLCNVGPGGHRDLAGDNVVFCCSFETIERVTIWSACLLCLRYEEAMTPVEYRLSRKGLRPIQAAGKAVRDSHNVPRLTPTLQLAMTGFFILEDTSLIPNMKFSCILCTFYLYFYPKGNKVNFITFEILIH